jgi:hypothetical protein
MKSWHNKEFQARRAVEDQGFVAYDANVLFRTNCPALPQSPSQPHSLRGQDPRPQAPG